MIIHISHTLVENSSDDKKLDRLYSDVLKYRNKLSIKDLDRWAVAYKKTLDSLKKVSNGKQLYNMYKKVYQWRPISEEILNNIFNYAYAIRAYKDYKDSIIPVEGTKQPILDMYTSKFEPHHPYNIIDHPIMLSRGMYSRLFELSNLPSKHVFVKDRLRDTRRTKKHRRSGAYVDSVSSWVTYINNVVDNTYGNFNSGSQYNESWDALYKAWDNDFANNKRKPKDRDIQIKEAKELEKYIKPLFTLLREDLKTIKD